MSQGRIGLLIGLDVFNGVTFAPGTQNVATVCFRASATVKPVSTPLQLVDMPIRREIPNADASSTLPANYDDGMVVITSGNAFTFEAITLPDGGHAQWRLLGVPGGVWGLEMSSDLLHWQRTATVTNVTGMLEYTDPLSPISTNRFYRAVQP